MRGGRGSGHLERFDPHPAARSRMWRGGSGRGGCTRTSSSSTKCVTLGRSRSRASASGTHCTSSSSELGLGGRSPCSAAASAVKNQVSKRRSASRRRDGAGDQRQGRQIGHHAVLAEGCPIGMARAAGPFAGDQQAGLFGGFPYGSGRGCARPAFGQEALHDVHHAAIEIAGKGRGTVGAVDPAAGEDVFVGHEDMARGAGGPSAPRYARHGRASG